MRQHQEESRKTSYINATVNGRIKERNDGFDGVDNAKK